MKVARSAFRFSDRSRNERGAASVVTRSIARFYHMCKVLHVGRSLVTTGYLFTYNVENDFDDQAARTLTQKEEIESAVRDQRTDGRTNANVLRR